MKYAQYINSAKWKKLRGQARERAGNRCEMCGGYADAVHHVQYPKRFEDDHIDNLISVCDYHHKQLHGIRGSLMKQKFEMMKLESAEQAVLSFTDDGGIRWVSLPDVLRALMDATVANSAGMSEIQRRDAQRIEYELRQQGKDVECKYFEWLEKGRPVNVCFVNARGAGRATMQAEGERAARLRSEMLDKLEPKQVACLADASVTGMLRQNAKDMLAICDELDNKVDRSEFYEKIAELQEASSIENRQKAATARQWLGMTQIAEPTTENAAKLGKKAREIWGERIGGAVPKIMEGTYQVGMWPLEILEEAARRLLWLPK